MMGLSSIFAFATLVLQLFMEWKKNKEAQEQSFYDFLKSSMKTIRSADGRARIAKLKEQMKQRKAK